MKLPGISINHYRFTLVVFILMTLAGVNSYFEMPRTEDPEILIPGASVFIIYPGASPLDMEELIAVPVEAAINEIDEIKKINTTLKDGFASIAVEFYFGTDAKEKYNEVVQQINSIKSNLPDGVYKIQTMRWSTSDVSMLQLALVSDSASPAYFDQKTDLLKTELEKVKGIKKIEIHALPEREIQVLPDFEKMANMNISLDQVVNAIQSANANIPGGDLIISHKVFSIKTTGSFKSLDEIRNTVVNAHRGRIIYLENIAEVKFDSEKEKYLARFNGHHTVFVTLNQKEGLNIFKTFEQIEPVLKRFRESLPGDMQLISVYNQAEEVDKKVHKFQSNLIQGILLVGLVIFLTLGIKSSLVVIIAIPLSILMGLLVVDLSGFGLQQISIAGLIVALGLLVDNSIVVTENINRFLEQGHSPKDAAVKATSEIGWPVVTATLTTVFAFIPIILMPDKTGEFIRSMPVTIIATLSFSMLIALSLTPMIAARTFKSNTDSKNVFQNRLFQNLIRKIVTGPYRKFLHYALNHKVLILSTSMLLLIISFYVFIQNGFSFFPKAEKPQFIIRMTLPEDASLSRTDEVSRDIEKSLDTISLVEYYASNVGHGNPRIYYNVMSKSYQNNFAEIFVRLKYFEVDDYNNLVEKLRRYYAHYPGAKITIKELQQGVPVTAPIDIGILGKDFTVLKEIAARFENVLENTPGVINLQNELAKDKTEVYVEVNKDKASMLGVPLYRIDQVVRAAFNGISISKYHDKKGKEYNIVLKMKNNETAGLDDFDKLFVQSLSGKMIPLKTLANINFISSPASVNRADFTRTAKLYADVAPGYNLDDVMNPVIEKLNNYDFPEGYSFKVGGELEAREESFGGMFNAMLIAMIAIFSVLVLQFRSFRQPLIIFIAIPFAMIGMTWALFLAGLTFSFTAFIGLISLIGIVVNNSIIMVDYTNVLIANGAKIQDAIRQAGEVRFTPIVLTTLTTIGGILPLTLGGGTLWAPLGWTIIGGLLFSTLLTLIVVPVLYEIMGEKREV